MSCTRVVASFIDFSSNHCGKDLFSRYVEYYSDSYKVLSGSRDGIDTSSSINIAIMLATALIVRNVDILIENRSILGLGDCYLNLFLEKGHLSSNAALVCISAKVLSEIVSANRGSDCVDSFRMCFRKVFFKVLQEATLLSRTTIISHTQRRACETRIRMCIVDLMATVYQHCYSNVPATIGNISYLKSLVKYFSALDDAVDYYNDLRHGEYNELLTEQVLSVDCVDSTDCIIVVYRSERALVIAKALQEIQYHLLPSNDQHMIRKWTLNWLVSARKSELASILTLMELRF